MTDVFLLFNPMNRRTFQHKHDFKEIVLVQVSVLQRGGGCGSIFELPVVPRPYLGDTHIEAGQIKVFPRDDIGTLYFVKFDQIRIGIADMYAATKCIRSVYRFEEIIWHRAWLLLTSLCHFLLLS